MSYLNIVNKRRKRTSELRTELSTRPDITD